MGFDPLTWLPEAAPQADPQQGFRVASEVDRAPVWVTQIGVRGGELVFTGEVLFWREIATVKTASSPAWLRREWKWGADASTLRRAQRDPTQHANTASASLAPPWSDGTCLMISAWPWSSGLSIRRRLLAWCDDDDRRERDLLQARLDDRGGLEAFLEQTDPDPRARFGRPYLDYDYFERREPIRGASLPASLWPRATGAERASSARRQHQRGLVLGLCPDLPACRRQLAAAPQLQALDARLDPLPERLRGSLTAHGAIRRNLDDHRGLLLWKAIDQALAGPRQFDGWLDEPVWKLAKFIYLAHLDQRDRARERRGRPPPKRPGDLPLQPLLDGDPAAWQRLLAAAGADETNAGYPPIAVARGLLTLLASDRDPGEREAASGALLRIAQWLRSGGDGNAIARFQRMLDEHAAIAELQDGLAQLNGDLGVPRA